MINKYLEEDLKYINKTKEEIESILPLKDTYSFHIEENKYGETRSREEYINIILKHNDRN